MALLTGTDVVLGIGEEVVGAERDQIEFADPRVVKVISPSQPDVQGFVTVLAHQLVEFLANVVHSLYNY